MLTTSVERLEGNNVKLTVTVSADEVDAAIKSAYESVGKKVRIPGFRKGHAPRPVVDNYLGKDYVASEATEALIDATYSRALDIEDLRPIESPEMEQVELVVAGEDFTYSADVALRPELTLSSTDPVSVTVPPREVTDAQLDEQMENARNSMGSLEPVEGRAVAQNDFVLLTFVGDVDGEAYEGNTVDKYMYELGKGQMPKEFDDGLIGMMPGDEKRIEFVIPETGTVAEYHGKTAGFDVTVHEIKQKVLPEINDEFAESVGGYDSVEQMREDLKTRLAGSQELKHQRAKESAAKAALAARLEGEVPEAMVRSKATQMLRDFRNQLDQQDMTVESYCAMVGVPVEALEIDINNQAARSVKEDLALEALFRAEGMEVTEEDIRAEVLAVVTNPEEADERYESWKEAGFLSVVRDELAHRKAVEWLMDKAMVTETDGTTAGDAAATAAEETEE